MINSLPYVSVVIPCYNEEAVVEFTGTRVSKVLESLGHSWEIIFVDDGSEDETFAKLESIALQDERVRVLKFSRNFGHEAATSAGLKWSRGELTIILDADLQDPPELIPDLIERYQKNDCDVVYGLRRRRKGEGFLKKLTSKLFYRLMRYASSLELPNDVGDFRLMNRAVVDAFNAFPERRRFVRGILAEAGFRQVPLEYDRDPRAAGETKYTFGKLLRLAIDVLLSHSTKPLRAAMNVGFVTILVGLGLAIYAVIGRYTNYEPGWASTVIIIVFFGGVQLFSIGVVGEYLGTVLVEVKGRPIFIVSETRNTHAESNKE